MNFRRVMAVVVGVAAVLCASGPSGAAPLVLHRSSAFAVGLCSSGYVEAQLSWGDKCLRAGEFCKVGNVEYHAYGFDCPAGGHLISSSLSPPATPSARAASSMAKPRVSVGGAVLLLRRTRTSGCRLAVLPDRRCSPGAYYSGLTRAVICSASFRTSSVRNVSESEKHQVELEYGLAPRGYGSTLEIDHIVSLELGGSNDVANLFPEREAFPNRQPGFRVKDRLENRLHDLVCAGEMTLSGARRQIAADWEALYRRVFGAAPSG